RHGDHGLLIGVFEEAWGKWRTGLGPRILAKAGKLIRCGLDGAIANHRAADRLVGRLFVRPLTACAAPTTEPVSDWLHATRILSRRQPGLGDAPLAQLRAKAGWEWSRPWRSWRCPCVGKAIRLRSSVDREKIGSSPISADD